MVKYVKPMVILCAQVYLGVQKDRTEPETINECTRFIYDKFKQLGVEEIKEAFSMAAANYFEGLDIRPYFGTFTVAILGNILSKYSHYRTGIVAEMQKRQAQAEKEEREAAERMARNEETRQEVCKEILLAIAAANDGMPFWEHWNDIPIHYSRIALETGTISIEGEKKKELWHEAQRLARQEVIELAQDVNRFLEAKRAKDIVKALTDGLEVAEVKDNAVRIYSKLIIWEFVKPKTNG